MDGIQNSRIENNLIYGNHASGISLYRIDGGGPSSGNVVVNNTIYQAADARWALNIQNAAVNNTVRNNILLNQSSRGAIDISADRQPNARSVANLDGPGSPLR
jgi:parallel beta-helix repeat protein